MVAVGPAPFVHYRYLQDPAACAAGTFLCSIGYLRMRKGHFSCGATGVGIAAAGSSVLIFTGVKLGSSS
jgi:hypothetical protein